MPWVPELFSAPIIARFEAKQRQKVVDIPYFEGLLAGRPTARAPLLPPDPELRTPTPVGRYIGGFAGCDGCGASRIRRTRFFYYKDPERHALPRPVMAPPSKRRPAASGPTVGASASAIRRTTLGATSTPT
jgi:hypothetical protein